MQIWMVAGLCCALGVLLGAVLAWQAQRNLQRRQAQSRNLRAQRGEQHAASLLTDRGYRIVDRQRRIAYPVGVGASQRVVELVLDYVVARGGEELVAEVKTGAGAPQLKNAETRRQLLEYQLATGCSRVLLVDPEQARITEVCFPIAREASATPSDPANSFAARVALLLLVLAAACWTLLRQP